MEPKEHHNSCAKHIDITLRCTCERENDWDRRTDRINREMEDEQVVKRIEEECANLINTLNTMLGIKTEPRSEEHTV